MSTVTPRRSAPPRNAAPARTAPRPGTVSIDPFRVMRRHMLLLFAAFFVGGGLGVGSFYLLRVYYPLFKGAVLFEVQPGVSEAGDVSTTGRMKEEEVAQVGETQLVLLSSRQVLREAVSASAVRNTSWFKKNYDKGGADSVEEAVDDLEESIKTGILRGTRLFQVEWSTHDREDVPTVLEAIAQAYIEARSDLDDIVYESNLETFGAQLDKTNQEIDDLNLEIKEFIRQKGIQSLDDPRYGQTAQAVTKLTEQLAVTKQQVSYADTGLKQDQAKLEGRLDYSPEDLREAEADYSVAQSIRSVEAMKVQARSLREKYPEEHAEVRGVDSQLRAAEGVKKDKIDEVIRRNLQGRIISTANALQQAETSLAKIEEELELRVSELQELASSQSEYDSMVKRRDYQELRRDRDDELIQQVRILRVRKDASQVKIYQLPMTPRDVHFPKLVIMVPLMTLLTVGFVVGVIFLQELTYSRIKSASDLAVVPGARVMGVLPDLGDDPTKIQAAELVVLKSPQSVLAESYRQTTAMIHKALDLSGHQTLLFSSGMPGSGTTTVAVNVAASLASSGLRVCIVDANFRRPALASLVGRDAECIGFADLLHQEGTLDEVIASSDSGFDVICAGSPARRIPERLQSEAFRSVIAELRARYDLVIFDAPPAMVAGDAQMLSNHLDCMALVVRADAEERGLIARLINQFGQTQCEVLGIILNRPRGTAGGYFKKNYAAMASYARGA